MADRQTSSSPPRPAADDRGTHPRVFLVGAGPGDPDLITVKGRRLLACADVVMYDALVDPRLLEPCRADARLIFVGKRAGAHSLPQTEINVQIIEHARAGHMVVRLKGGDPFIFGRGGEEALALAAAGIPFEVVPGVSSAVGVPAYAGVPLTHREFSSELVLLTGHERSDRSGVPVEWARYAPSRATLVIFMGRERLPMLADLLLANGRDPDCPVAVIYAGTTPRQRTIVAPLKDIASRAASEGIDATALIVVGEVVRLREVLQWFGEAEAGPPADLR